MELNNLRKDIDLIDNEILLLLKKRFDVVEKISIYKKENKIEVVQYGRWQELLSLRKNKASTLCINENMIEEIWELIHKYAISKEKEIINN
ncbi:MAG: chorismate mutase [Candidatus Gracilibacteria bacterium]|nr:chorismate mutase [Candidatus Gracilibacteria bacterium]MDD2908863.1 chorismate mutase [Candidatus Gracilibacteria bacterium]